MAWRTRMQRASFRGVPFGVMQGGAEGGRRLARHEYPGRDDPWVEDLGRKARVWTLDLHVVGPDYMSARDRLIEALEQPGAAELVHPWLGRVTVAVESYRLRESTRDGGRATFSVTFVEAGQRRYPSAAIDTAGVVTDRAKTARAQSVATFAQAFSVAGLPGWVADEARAVLTSATDALQTALAMLPAPAADLGALLSDADAFRASLGTLLASPADIAAQMDGLVARVGGIASDPLPAVSVYQSLGGFGATLPPVPETTPARKQQAANQAATVALMQQLALAGEAHAAATATFSAAGEATGVRDDLADRLDAAAVATADDSLWQALTDLRAAVVDDLTRRAAELPRLRTVTMPSTMPALVVAHRVWGDASRDGEIVSRNRLPHPGFVPGGAPLEVLGA